jgi:carbonic anhydrase
MRDYTQLLLSNKAWAKEMVDENPEFFTRQIAGQKPDFLWIGCSDSRVSPEQMTMTHPGGMFMHRNIGNLVNADDENLSAVLQYAVETLKVSHIIICGHYGCSGVMSAIDGGTQGPMHEWLAGTRALCADHKHELDALGAYDAKVDRVVELNVIDQVRHLSQMKTVQDAFHAGQPLVLHGWVYNLRDGLIRPLVEMDAQSVAPRQADEAEVEAVASQAA